MYDSPLSRTLEGPVDHERDLPTTPPLAVPEQPHRPAPFKAGYGDTLTKLEYEIERLDGSAVIIGIVTDSSMTDLHRPAARRYARRGGSRRRRRDLGEVQRRRAARRTRAGRPATRQVYALPMLRCGARGRRLIGDSGPYRHREPCAEFSAARRRRAWKNQLVKSAAHSYAAKFYEDLVPHALAVLALSTRDLVTDAAWYAEQLPAPDPLAVRRVAAERERALARYARDRDVAALEREMARLDAEERAVSEVEDLSSPPPTGPRSSS